MGPRLEAVRTWVAARPWLAAPLALLMLLVMVVLGLVVVLLQLVVFLFSLLLKPLLTFFFPIVVEHLYMWPCVGAAHVWLLSYGRRGRPDKLFHSRFLDLRVQVCTEAPLVAVEASSSAPPRQRAQRFVHLIPQFQDNYAYLVVDAVEILLPCTGPGPRDGSFGDKSDRGVRKTMYFAALVDPADQVALEVALNQIDALYYSKDLQLQMVLTTHKHWDHQSGNLWLAHKYGSELAFYTGEESVLSRLGKANAGALLAHGDSLELRYALVPDGCEVRPAGGACTTQRSAAFEVAPGWRLRVDQVVMRAGAPQTMPAPSAIASLRIDVLATPCHTRGHVVFLLREVRHLMHACTLR